MYAPSLFLLAVIASCYALPAVNDQNLQSSWTEYKNTFEKTYKDGADEREHFEHFVAAKSAIDEHNAAFERGEVTFKLAVNSHADMSPSEYQQRKGLRLNAQSFQHIWAQRDKMSKFSMNDIKADLPKAVDWRNGNNSLQLVSQVKDQGQCGSCWAFSTTGVLEAAHAKATGKLVELSEQNLVDCDFLNAGCDGGFPLLSLAFVIDEQGLNTEDIYKYKAYAQNCKFDKKNPIGAQTVKGFASTPEGDEVALMAAVATQGPVSIAIDASSMKFSWYSGGVYIDSKCGSGLENLDHAVLVVGYGEDEKAGPYWIVKNSWGKWWGENGYIRMARNRDSMCGVAAMPVYATL